jgi:hypothetical protein
MRLWRTTKHENSRAGRKSFSFSKCSGYFQSSHSDRTKVMASIVSIPGAQEDLSEVCCAIGAIDTR